MRQLVPDPLTRADQQALAGIAAKPRVRPIDLAAEPLTGSVPTRD